MGQIMADVVVFVVGSIISGILAFLFVVTIVWTILAFINKEKIGTKISYIAINLLILFLFFVASFLMVGGNSKTAIPAIESLLKKHF